TDPSDRGNTGPGCKIARFEAILVCAGDELIDLVGTKPGNLDRRVSDNEFAELGFQFANIPNAFFSQSVDGKTEQALLHIVQVIHTNTRYGRQTQQLGGFQPRVPIDHNIAFADQEGNIESKRVNRICDFTNMRWIVLPELAHVRF